MTAYIIRRILFMIPTLFGIMLATFVVVQFAPGGPVERILAQRPAQGTLPLTHFAEASGLYKLHDMVGALLIRDLHVWSDETVQARFAYRQPGLYVVPIRVYRMPQVVTLPEVASYAGCRSWVELERELPTEGATPVLSDAEFDDLRRRLDQLLHPTALA